MCNHSMFILSDFEYLEIENIRWAATMPRPPPIFSSFFFPLSKDEWLLFVDDFTSGCSRHECT